MGFNSAFKRLISALDKEGLLVTRTWRYIFGENSPEACLHAVQGRNFSGPAGNQGLISPLSSPLLRRYTERFIRNPSVKKQTIIKMKRDIHPLTKSWLGTICKEKAVFRLTDGHKRSIETSWQNINH
jgi:hypothetical protein